MSSGARKMELEIAAVGMGMPTKMHILPSPHKSATIVLLRKTSGENWFRLALSGCREIPPRA